MTIDTPTPEHMIDASPASQPNTSRRSNGPSCVASSRYTSPKTSAPTSVIWKGSTMFW